jgi:hypothetical protein
MIQLLIEYIFNNYLPQLSIFFAHKTNENLRIKSIYKKE